MANLREIRNRIKSVKNTQQMTRAMKMVSAAKLRRAQERILASRPYAYRLSDIVRHLQEYVDVTLHPLFKPRAEVNQVLLVVITSDRGLAGAFNANVIKLAEQTIEKQYAQYKEEGRLHLVCIGRKGYEYFSRRKYSIVQRYIGLFNRGFDFSTAVEIADFLTEGYEQGKWDKVELVYSEFRNTIAQFRVVEPFLPIPSESFLTPMMKRTLRRRAHPRPGERVNYIFEPEPQAIVNALVPRYLHFQVWRALLESSASEHGARMVAMDNATNNAGEMLEKLRLHYNRARQAAITKEILEIASGAEALRKQQE